MDEEPTIAALARSYRLVMAAFEREVGATQARVQLLGELRRSGRGRTAGTARQSELRDALGIDPAAVTRQLRQLESEGLVRREGDPDDRRALKVAITTEGRRLLTRLEKRSQGMEEHVLSGLSPRDVATLRKALGRMGDNVHGEAVEAQEAPARAPRRPRRAAAEE